MRLLLGWITGLVCLLFAVYGYGTFTIGFSVFLVIVGAIITYCALEKEPVTVYDCDCDCCEKNQE